MKKSNTVIHAENELKLAGWYNKDSIYGGLVPEAVLELVEVFAKQGHSGMSAPLVARIFKTVACHDLLSPLTGKDDEWFEHDDGHFQNIRLSSVFKKDKDSRAYYLDAIVFKGQSGTTFTSSSVETKDGSEVGSMQYITFPFTAKTFYIDVIETEWADKKETVKQKGGGWWTSIVKDESQLEEVWQYYDRYVKD